MDVLQADDFTSATACRLFDFSEGSIREPALRALVFDAALRAREAGIPVLYSVNLRHASWHLPDHDIIAVERKAAALSDIVILNADEVAFICGHPIEQGMKDIQNLGPRVVVVTQGGDGDVLLAVDGETIAVPIFQVPVIYDIGAGDTFHAGLAAAALRQHPAAMTPADWRSAVRFAAATAAIRVSTSADPHDLPTADTVMNWMQRQENQIGGA